MRAAVLTPIRLLGEAIAAALRASAPCTQVDIVRDIERLRALAAGATGLDIVIVDATAPVSLDAIRAFHLGFPGLPLLALGVREREAEIIAHGAAGFSGYLHREEGTEALCACVADAMAGRLRCPPEIAAAMMRGLFYPGTLDEAEPLPPLTKRENHVADLVSNGMSNKEIARALTLSESTVKHHVHSILGKWRLSTRMQLMRRMRRDPWANGRRAAP